MDLNTIIGAKLHTAARVGNLLVPGNSLTEHLRRFTEPALFHTPGLPPFEMTKGGSLFKARVGEKYFVLTSAHQVTNDGYQHDQLCLFDQKRNMLTSAGGAVFAEPQNGSETNLDCNIYDFTKPVGAGAIPKDGWYDLTMEWHEADLPKPMLVFGLGYPGYRNHIDYENLHYGISPNCVCGLDCAPAMSDRLSFIPDPPIEYDPAGMSGGPVFVLHLKYNELEIRFAGIITNASSRCFNFLPLVRIHQMIEHLLS